ncbi:aldo/keto reductase [Cohnella thailandensis]|uniref:Aldo/keto reductase n=1 Tax=Cohnella thailandensis TaxID=557557 RepID=A0A841T3A9_9BACL|nr:aldo/keto reductase [Cohnella thailandensis]MBB6636848.1 aldo/keto reductase [Cohnella thailandensis]MBP1973274.1 aryl-alcohol dehydrogenase-like predicted oxidoreductase [Cohnella thailandensis]
MERKLLGKTNLSVTALGFGSMEIRGTRVWNGRPISDEDSGKLLHAVLDAGINFIDTSYDYGRSEELIGKYIRGRRQEYVLATKCGCTLVDCGDHDETPHVWTRDNLLHNIETSLKRMGTDYVDLLQLHGPTAAQVEEGGLLEVLEEIKASGKARHIGISSYMPNLEAHLAGPGNYETYQLPYSALERDHETWIDRAADKGAGIIIRGGVGRGEPGLGLGQQDRWHLWDAAKLDELLEEGETRTGFLLRFTLSHPNLSTTIVGTMKPEHLLENVRVAEKGRLPADVYAEAKRRLDSVVK